MPFPQTPFTLTGGCKCKSIRYRVSVPAHSDRVLTPLKKPGSNVDARMPLSLLCHCNDCRSAVGQLGVAGLSTHTETISVSIMSSPTPSASDDEKREWKSWTAIAPSYEEGEEIGREKNFPLSRWESTSHRHRYFCGRCGTPLAYEVDARSLPAVMEWPGITLLWTGTLDRACLETGWMMTENIMNTALGIPWVRDQVRHGAKDAVEHPFVAIDTVGMSRENVEADYAVMTALGMDAEVTIWE